MELVKRISQVFFKRSSAPKLTNTLTNVKEADLVTEAIDKRLEEIKIRLAQKTIKQK